MENQIPVNIPNGVPSILDGAGEIKDLISPEAQADAEQALKDYEEQVAEQPQKMVAVDYKEFMNRVRTKPIIRDYKKIGRNDPCPCGSGKKYKNCCLSSGRYETTHQLGKE